MLHGENQRTERGFQQEGDNGLDRSGSPLPARPHAGDYFTLEDGIL